MAVTSSVGIKVNLSGDVTYGQQFNTASNVAAPGVNELKNLSSGNNTITVPSGADGVLIIPPFDNEEEIRLKSVNGDTGVAISKTNPTYLGLDADASFVLSAGDTITGVRLIWC